MDRHQERVARAWEAVGQARGQAAKDHWRLKYHLAPPAQWMNDPNGFCFFRGEYHLFYQHHPYSPYWNDMHWGHAKSKDLVRWEHLPIALAPSEPYDRDGCFSGSAVEKDGRLYLLYTGHRWTGEDRDKDLEQVQCLAFSDDGVRFDKYEGNPVIAEAPEGDVHPHHFRDPKVWKRGDEYYCVVGSRTREHVGQIALYRSKDLKTWTFVSLPAIGRDNAGFMWECPDLFRLDGRDVLVYSPQGVKPEGDRFHNLHQSGYRIGALDYETGAFEHGAFETLDDGFDFYAPQTTEDEQGRRLLIAWMAMWESDMPEQNRGWAGAMTLPRELKLVGDKLASVPAAELETLRGELTEYADVPLQGELTLPGVAGDCCELELELELGDAVRVGVVVRASEDGAERTELAYDRAEGKLIFDRNRSGQGPGGVRRTAVALRGDRGDRLSLRVFLDRSSVEAFVQGGEKTMTGRVYPSPGSNGIRLFADGPGARIARLRFWPLRGEQE